MESRKASHEWAGPQFSYAQGSVPLSPGVMKEAAVRSGKRAERVGELILKEVAFLLLEKAKDPRVRGVTLTGIHLSNDLKSARIFFSTLGGEREIRQAQSGLDSAKGFIKREIAAQMELRYVPDISFIHDPTLEKADRLEQLFHEIRKEEGE